MRVIVSPYFGIEMEKLPESERTRISKWSDKTLNKHLIEDAGWDETALEQTGRPDRLQAWAQFCFENAKTRKNSND